jgi:hypothetical protein
MSTYSPIATQTLTGAVSTITFTNIPQSYTDLIVVSNVAFNNTDSLSFRFNGDNSSSTLYSWTLLSGNGSGAVSTRNSNSARGLADYNGFPTSTIGQSVSIAQIMNYSNTSTFKTILSRGNSASSGHGTDALVNLYRSTSPITSMTLGMGTAQTQNFVVGSTISLYGIAAGSTKAQGGLVTNDGTYYYHTFLSSGVFTPNEALTCDYLVVAGGGGGGQNTGGGGGAGGYRTSLGGSALSLTAQNYAVTVGAGGLGGNFTSNTASAGVNGSNSSFSTITSSGGGGGAGSGTTADGLGGKNGGSGGGASRGGISAQNGGTGNSGGYSPVEGYAGGNNGPSSPGGNSGGGGGAGAVGADATAGQSGNGGAGRNTNSVWATATNTGVSGYYAGGGGGGAYSTAAGAGGAGGGGAGSMDSVAVPVNGTANTGGGGGGMNNNNNPPNGNRGANGGSGIVIVRYAI